MGHPDGPCLHPLRRPLLLPLLSALAGVQGQVGGGRPGPCQAARQRRPEPPQGASAVPGNRGGSAFRARGTGVELQGARGQGDVQACHSGNEHPDVVAALWHEHHDV